MRVKKIKIYADGGSRGNPGPSAAGYILADERDQILEKGGKYLGETTNNQAEYQALIIALQLAQKYSPEAVDVHMDSQLVVNQLTGVYKVKNVDLKPLVEIAKVLIGSLRKVQFVHVLREFNQLADEQVNIILDQQGD